MVRFPGKPEHEEGKAWPAIVIGIFVAFGGVLFGCVTTNTQNLRC